MTKKEFAGKFLVQLTGLLLPLFRSYDHASTYETGTAAEYYERNFGRTN